MRTTNFDILKSNILIQFHFGSIPRDTGASIMLRDRVRNVN